MKIKNAIETNNGQTYIKLANPTSGEYDRHVTRVQIGDRISGFAPLAETHDLAVAVDDAIARGDADAVAAIWYRI